VSHSPVMSRTDRTARFSRAVLMLSGLVSAGSFLSGCAPLIVGGVAATSISVASDRRSAGEQLDDKSIQLKVSAKLSELLDGRGRYNVVSYAGRVLLLGDVPDETVKQQAEQQTSEIEPVRDVVNRLRVGAITPFSVRNNDTWLTTKVTGNLINTERVPARTISVTTERGVVYLMGKVTPEQAQLAANVAAGVNGVNQVVTLFHLIEGGGTAAAVNDAPASSTDGAENTNAADANASPDAPGVQALPVQ